MLDLLSLMKVVIFMQQSQSFSSSPWSPHTKTTIGLEVPSNCLSFWNYHMSYCTMCIENTQYIIFRDLIGGLSAFSSSPYSPV